MSEIINVKIKDDRSPLIRIGGLAGLSAIVVHMIVNMFLKTFPSESFTAPELEMYFRQEAGTWEVVHGLRYLAMAGIVFMVTGLYLKTGTDGAKSENGWRLIGLLGATMWLANLMITNGIEMFAFLDYESMDSNPALFWMIFDMTRVLFGAEIIAWTLVAFGFSMAGKRSRKFPAWLSYVGILMAVGGFIASITIVNVLKDGWTSYILLVAAFGIIFWFASASVNMIRKDNRT